MNFLTGITNWNNHRPLLWLALENTKGAVLEMGMGEGSTPYLIDYCKKNDRKLVSYDNDKSYIEKFNHGEYIIDWYYAKTMTNYGVALIDHAPAERRHIDAIALKDTADIVIVHDAEHEGMDYDVYQISKITAAYKYRLNLTILPHAARTIMLSNVIDVSKLKIPEFELQ